MRPISILAFALVLPLLTGCLQKDKVERPGTGESEPAPAYFKADPATAGTITGSIRFIGRHPAPKAIDMSEEPACVTAHHGKPYDESLLVNKNGKLANVFIYIKGGLEGKNFEIPSTPVTIDQSGCWFRPRLIGIQAGQPFRVVNSDPVTHNIHPMAQMNREWNHSQGAGDPPITRKFIKPEIMIPVKCNIHSWMHAYIGVVDNPYFATSNDDGSFTIGNLPPGTYTLAVWHEKLGAQEQQITVSPKGSATATFTFKEK